MPMKPRAILVAPPLSSVALAHAGDCCCWSRVTVALGNWQRQRACTRRRRCARSSTRRRARRRSRSTRPADAADWTALRFRAVARAGDVRRGAADPDRQQGARRPRRLSRRDAAEARRRPRYVLVDRGWVAQGRRRAELPQVAAAGGRRRRRRPRSICRRRAISSSARDAECRAGAAEPRHRAHRREQRAAVAAGHRRADAATAGDGLVRDWPAPDFGVEQHRSYMVQWYSFAALARACSGSALNWRRDGASAMSAAVAASSAGGRRTLLLIALVGAGADRRVVRRVLLVHPAQARQLRRAAGDRAGAGDRRARRRRQRRFAWPTCAAAGCCSIASRAAATTRARGRSTRRGRRARCRDASRTASSACWLVSRRRADAAAGARWPRIPASSSRSVAQRALERCRSARAPTAASCCSTRSATSCCAMAADPDIKGLAKDLRAAAARRRRSARPRRCVKSTLLCSALVRRAHRPMTTARARRNRFRQFLALTKPRVVSLIVFSAVIGMFLAVARRCRRVGARGLRHARHRAGRRRGRGDQLPGRAEDRRA